MKGDLLIALLLAAAVDTVLSLLAFRTACSSRMPLLTTTPTEKQQQRTTPVTSTLLSAKRGEDSSSSTPTVTGEEFLPSDTEKEFSAYYRQDPQDANADSFLQGLSPSRREQLEDCFKQLHTTRKRREFETSDAICAKVRGQFGVRIYNDPPVWTTQKGAAPPSYIRRKQTKAVNRLKERYGPKGHPYAQVGEGIKEIICPLSLVDIHDLLSQHTLARVEGRQDKAEAIKFELLINGVQCNDEYNQWRADGENMWDDLCFNVEGIGSTQDLVFKEQGSAAQSMEATKEGLQITEEGRPRVEQLIRLRADGIVRKDTDLVRSLLTELWKTYGVGVDDTRQTWSFQTPDGAKSEESSPVSTETTSKSDEVLVPPLLFTGNDQANSGRCSFRLSIHSRALPDDTTLNRIQHLVEERVQKREEAKFLEADAIRKELWMTYHVGVNDRLRQWSVGGVFDDDV